MTLPEIENLTYVPVKPTDQLAREWFIVSFGRDYFTALATEELTSIDDPEALAQLAQARLRNKIAELEQALTGRIRDSHRLLLKLHLEHIDDLNAKLEQLEAEIGGLMRPFDLNNLVERFNTNTGRGQKKTA